MIAIRDRGFAQVGLYPSSIGEMFELLLAGDNHWDLSVSNIFFQARQLAASAVSENSETPLVVAALLFRPCQMLASGSFQSGDWTSDSLLETGTYDWLVKNFGDEIAETIRLQPIAKRFLATIDPEYFGHLNSSEQKNVLSNGGFMTASERMTFGNLRCHCHAMKIASWIDRGVGRYLEIPDMDFFMPFVERSLKSS
jgi:predicted HD phosphohydrolase